MHLTKILIIFLIISSPAYGSTYHVSADGNDANTGLSYAQRWATPQKACDTAVAGDTVNFYDDGGIFHNPGTAVNTIALCITNTGTVGNPITFQAATGEIPIFEPAQTVGSWTSIGGNVYESDAFISNNNRAATQLWKDGDDLDFVGQTCGASLDTEGEYCTCNSGCTSNTRVRIYTASDPNLSTYRAAAAATSGEPSMGFSIRDVEYIHVKGIKSQYSNMNFRIRPDLNTANNITLEEVTSDYAYNIGIDWENDATFPITSGLCLNCNSYHTGGTIPNQSEHGIKGASGIAGTQSGGLIIDGGEFAYNSWHGIQVSEGWDNVIVRNVYSHDNNQQNNSDGSDIRVGNQQVTPIGSQVYDNIVGGTKYGIGLFGQVSGTVIKRNLITGATTAGIHYDDTVGSPLGTNIVVANNIIRDGKGVLIDANNSNFIFENNTLDNITGSAVKILSTVTGGTLKNNIIIVPTGANLLEIEPGALYTSNNNAFYSPDSTPFSYNGVSYNFSNYKAASSQDTNSINSNFTSEFVNYAGDDFSITYAGAPSLRDAGTTLAIVTDDYEGTARPQNSGYAIGAYEEEGVVSGGAVTLRGLNLTGVSVQ